MLRPDRIADGAILVTGVALEGLLVRRKSEAKTENYHLLGLIQERRFKPQYGKGQAISYVVRFKRTISERFDILRKQYNVTRDDGTNEVSKVRYCYAGMYSTRNISIV